MGTTALDEIYKQFQDAAGQQAAAVTTATYALADVVAQIGGQLAGQTGQLGKAPAAAEPGNTAAYALVDVVAQIGAQQSQLAKAPAGVSTKSTPQGDAGSAGSTAASEASSWATGKFAFFPLISGLISLFSGGAPEAPPPLTKYAMPASNHFQTAETANGLSWSDADQMGAPRAFGSSGAAGTAPGWSVGQAATPQITVNVQAMDARSFLDRSHDIAMAVRDAMLNLNSINDVVNDL